MDKISVIVEIKNPMTKIMVLKYRENIYTRWKILTGFILLLLDYRVEVK